MGGGCLEYPEASTVGVGFGCGCLGSKTSGQDLCPVVLDLTLPHFVNSQLVASCHLGLLIIFLLSLNCFFQSVKSG